MHTDRMHQEIVHDYTKSAIRQQSGRLQHTSSNIFQFRFRKTNWNLDICQAMENSSSMLPMPQQPTQR